jgi:quercetin dioxygenase-like cupin family protein
MKKGTQMRLFNGMFVTIVATMFSVAALAQDSAVVSPSINHVLVDNAHVRVVKSTFKPGASEGTHTHPAGWYIVTKGGTLKITKADGTSEEWKAKTGEQSWQEFEGAHQATNVGKGVFEYIYVEVKSAAAPAKK